MPTAGGYVKNTVVAGANRYNYVYNHTDHLGNVRLSYGQDPVTQQVKILEENNYYPFGMKHRNYNMSEKFYKKSGAGVVLGEEICATCPLQYKYNYKYNGKEFQDELGLNMYDYENRTYDPATGRWWQIDPLAEQGRRWSPYAYAMDNPVYFIDPDGMWPENPFKGLINRAKTAVNNTVKNAVGYVAATGYSVAKRVVANATSKIIEAITPSLSNPFTKAKPESAPKASGSGISFTTEGGKSGGMVSPQGGRDTKTVDVSVIVGLTDIYGPPTTLPGVAPDGSNPFNAPAEGTPAESTMSKATSSENDDKIEIKIPESTFDISPNSKSANHHYKDTTVNKIDSAKVVNKAEKKQKEDIKNFNKKYGTNF